MKLKKIVALGLVTALSASALTACGEKKDGGGSSADGGEFVVGGIGPITGSTAVYGLAVKNGAQIAIDEINEDGGANGMKLKLDFQDDEQDAEKAVNAYNALKDNGMRLLMGTVTSTPCVAVSEKSNEDNIFQITPSGSAVECIEGRDNTFRICFNDPNQGVASAQYIAEHKLANKVAVIYNSSDVYSNGIYEKFAAEAKKQNLEVAEAEAFTSDSKTDFSVQIQKIKDSGADLVFLPIYYQEAALILQQADKAGLKVKFFGCDGLDGILDQLKDNKALAEEVMLLTPFAADASDDLTKKFVETYKKNYSETPIQFAADAYDAIYAIKAALEKAEVKDAKIDPSELCDKMKTAMTEINVAGLTGDMTWTADGEPTKEPKAVKIVNGAYTAMD